MKMNSMNLIILKSPWPFMVTINLMSLTMNLITQMNKSLLAEMTVSLFLVSTSILMWMMNSMKEKLMSGMMSMYNEMSMKTMIYFIIMTETMFFLSFFYINFSMSYFNNTMFNLKFSMNMFKLNFILSFTNLMILLTSSMTLMISTLLNEKYSNKSMKFLKSTIILGNYFIMIQMVEYLMLNFNMSNSIFFSNFFMLTMFHMSHVMMGSMIMTMMKFFKKHNLFSNKTKLKMMCWYWHFIDMIWVLIFVTLYTK
uniref:cytochrome c oxidase subunit III n=1 Tax=Coccus hesperidum TaxID=538890 RepID=UPI002E764932|nr:cytochrome c oxidase subunit III [Coccus hesperidum]WRH36481.1 cytochrome c oxidase subunit III [Coccus hesperidum]